MNRRAFLTRAGAVSLSAVMSDLMPARSLPASLQSVVPTRLSASMWTYLWDVVDEGYDVIIGRLKEHGLTSISLATAYHAGKFLAPHNPKRKVVFPEDGTVYFAPRFHLYSRIRPRVSTLVQQGHGLTQLKKHADSAGLETRAWVVCCHNSALGMEYPSCVCRDAFGDAIYHNLCPNNSDVRTYLGTLLRDIASEGVTTIELEALQFQGYQHEFHHEREGIPLTDGAKFLLGLCFCSSCMERATYHKVAIEEIQKYTRTTLERYFENPEAFAETLASPTAFPSDLFDPFLEWRRTSVLSLAEDMMNGIYPMKTRLRPIVSLDPAAQQMAGVDPGAVAAVTGGILTTGYVKDGTALRDPLTAMQTKIGQNKLTVGFQVGLPESGGKEEFASRMKTARELGITSFNFYNYGMIPLSHLEWVKESLQ